MTVQSEVLLGDARDVLATLPDASVDAIVTDPPYALTQASRGGSRRHNDPTKPYGRHRLADKGFMGQQWDNGTVAHDPAFWAEVLRVARPGAHLVAFGGTRTAHRLACAIEDAGWEIRDSVYWLYGQGFPKSLDVSKAIDKAAGKQGTFGEPKSAAHAGWIARGRMRGTAGHDGWQRPWLQDSGAVDHNARAYVPATREAQQWEGWGTALKPAVEPIVLARKPLAEGTVAANVLAHGTGALHIDAARVPTGDVGTARAYEPREDREQWRITGGSTGSGATSSAGRWPPNLLFSHHPDCQPLGVRRVKGITGTKNGSWRHGHQYSGGFAGASPEELGEPVGYADADGYEEVSAYACVDGCPVKALDEQAGPRRSGAMKAGTRRASTGGYRGAMPDQTLRDTYGDAGAVSRFFPTFHYVSKASRAEREDGLDDMPVARSAYRPNDSDENTIRTRLHGSRARHNHHPTVKPIALMSWLCTLITAPGGTILDPFAGSGSTGVSCVREGFGFIGIEQEAGYVEIARRRIAHAQEQQSGPLFAACASGV